MNKFSLILFSAMLLLLTVGCGESAEPKTFTVVGLLLATLLALLALLDVPGDWHGRWPWESEGPPRLKACPICGYNAPRKIYESSTGGPELDIIYICYKCARTGALEKGYFKGDEPENRESSVSKLILTIALVLAAISIYFQFGPSGNGSGTSQQEYEEREYSGDWRR
mgnify:CR=1 FL=1